MNSASSKDDWVASSSDIASSNDDVQWERKFLLLPRFALKISREGMRRRLLLPGTYETRVSRRYGKRVFRDLPD